MSLCLSVGRSVCLSVGRSVCLAVCLSVCEGPFLFLFLKGTQQETHNCGAPQFCGLEMGKQKRFTFAAGDQRETQVQSLAVLCRGTYGLLFGIPSKPKKSRPQKCRSCSDSCEGPTFAQRSFGQVPSLKRNKSSVGTQNEYGQFWEEFARSHPARLPINVGQEQVAQETSRDTPPAFVWR